MVSISGTILIAYHNGPLRVVGYGHKVFLSESESPEKLFIIECQYETDGFCPERSGSFSAVVSLENVQD